MLEQIFLTASSRQRVLVGPLAPHLKGLAACLVSQGFARSSSKNKLRLIAALSAWLGHKKVPLSALNEALIEQFLTHHRRRYVINGGGATAKLLLDYLRKLDVIAPPAQTEDDSALNRITKDYARFLVRERGLAPSTVQGYLRTVRDFLGQRFADKAIALDALTPQDAHRYILDCARRISRTKAQGAVTTLRSFFRFLHQRGEVSTDLAAALPSVANWRLSQLPKSLTPEQVEGLLRSCDRRSAIGRRDYAILLLLARLGLRAGEVVALMLEDLDWETGTFTVHGKGDRRERLPLPHDVGEALVRYLRQDRPACASRRVFIRMVAPFQGFSTSAAIDNVVKRALTRAGLDPPFKGAHLLRHSLATGMLHRGASLAEIGDILRHCRADTTQIYAKVNDGALRALAPPWPGGTS